MNFQVTIVNAHHVMRRLRLAFAMIVGNETIKLIVSLIFFQSDKHSPENYAESIKEALDILHNEVQNIGLINDSITCK